MTNHLDGNQFPNLFNDYQGYAIIDLPVMPVTYPGYFITIYIDSLRHVDNNGLDNNKTRPFFKIIGSCARGNRKW